MRMMYKVMLLGAVLLGSCLFGASGMSAQPRLVMLDSFDFGTVVPPYNNEAKNVLKADIDVSNVGDSVLIVTSIRVQCGCTVASMNADTIPPGETRKLQLEVTLFQGNGTLEKYVTVFTNEPNARAHALHFKVDIQRALQLGSGFLAFNTTTVGTPTVAQLTVFVNQLKGATISVTPVTKGLSVMPKTGVKIEAKGSVDFFFSYIPTVAGTFSVNLELNSDVPGYEKIELMGYGTAD
ncbi:MAG: DUF1573 domain-containing protein [Ignavibacteria bacterium]|nr:DUF1573 domain-containing protein [Ignavibacteria bacterium]